VDPISRLNSKLSFFIMYSTLLITFVVVYEVATRYFLNMADSRAIFVSVWLYGILFTLGGAYTLHEGGHVSVDIVYRKVPERVRKVLDIIDIGVVMVSGIILILVGAPIAWRSFMIREVDSSLGIVFAPPIWWFKWVAVISVVLITLQTIPMLLEKIKQWEVNQHG